MEDQIYPLLARPRWPRVRAEANCDVQRLLGLFREAWSLFPAGEQKTILKQWKRFKEVAPAVELIDSQMLNGNDGMVPAQVSNPVFPAFDPTAMHHCVRCADGAFRSMAPEAAVYLIAHELVHCHQWATNKPCSPLLVVASPTYRGRIEQDAEDRAQALCGTDACESFRRWRQAVVDKKNAES